MMMMTMMTGHLMARALAIGIGCYDAVGTNLQSFRSIHQFHPLCASFCSAEWASRGNSMPSGRHGENASPGPGPIVGILKSISVFQFASNSSQQLRQYTAHRPAHCRKQSLPKEQDRSDMGSVLPVSRS